MERQPPPAGLPPFSGAGPIYYSLPLKPPFTFDGMTARVFPLRASLTSLQRFCDRYLNCIPEEVGRFRANVPYIYLMMLDYGRLALEVANLGWLAQREIYFCLPVEWYEVKNGRWVFKDWATVAPFIYVDDDFSAQMGRTVYGWPKTTVTWTETLSRWLKNPVAPIDQATVSTLVFPEIYQGLDQETRVFLEIERSAPPSNLRLPLDTDAPYAPWTVARNLANAAVGFGRDWLALLEGFGIVPMHPGSTAANYAEMARRAVDALYPLKRDFLANTINLKQFRRSEDPQKYCYQALTNGPMRTTAVNRVGLLGEDRILTGDVTGGYKIKLYDWPSLPIVETLGLEVARRHRGQDADLLELTPVLPFWYDVNMSYLPGTNLVWRDGEGVWHQPSTGRRFAPPSGDDAQAAEARLYNTTLGAAGKAVAGPFQFDQTSVRVLPLLARAAKLKAYIDEYLNSAVVSGGQRFELWQSGDGSASHAYVYLTATTFGSVTSLTNNIGDWADEEVSFYVPVRRFRLLPGGDPESTDPADWQLAGVGLVPAFTYVDSVTAAASASEVLGIPTNTVVFEQPDSAWMSRSGPDAARHQSLLRVNAEVLPAIGEGQQAIRQRVLDISAGYPIKRGHGARWRVGVDRWAAVLTEENERMKAIRRDESEVLERVRSLALGMLGAEVPVTIYTLKQFRDVADPERACYQSIVKIQRALVEAMDLREMETPLTVHLHEFPSLPVANLLGLVGRNVREGKLGVVFEVQPIRPFWMRVNVDESLGQPLMSRCGSHQWKPEQNGPDPYAEPVFGAGLGERAPQLLDQGDPRRLAHGVLAWRALQATDSTFVDVSGEQAREAVARVDPQTVVESILSHEWGNWSPGARWQVGREDVLRRRATALSAVDPHDLLSVELAFFQKLMQDLLARPGTASFEDAMPMLAQLERLGELDVQVTKDWMAIYAAVKPYAQAVARHEDAVVPGQLPLLEPLKSLLTQLIGVNRLTVFGDPVSPDNGGDFQLHDNFARFQALVDAVFTPMLNALLAVPQPPDGVQDPERWTSPEFAVVRDSAWEQQGAIRDGIVLADQRVQLQRDALVNRIARAWQKPEFVVRRGLAGPEADRLFPMAQSWDADWFVGPEPGQIREQLGKLSD